MVSKKIQTSWDLRNFIINHINELPEPPDLGTFLLSFLNVLIKNGNPPPSYSKLANFLLESINLKNSGHKILFDPSWISLRILMSEPNSSEYHKEIYSFDHCIRLLKVQIAQIKKMQEDKSFYSEDRYFGVRSNGSIWYNFTVPDFLERGSCFLQNYSKNDPEFKKCDWFVVSCMLSDGQTHE